jgi:hypothetical protein
VWSADTLREMMSVFVSLLLAVRSSVRSRAALQIEVLALRHQLCVLQRSRPHRVRLPPVDRFLWAWLSRAWTQWRAAIIIVKPETVIAWHRRLSAVLALEKSPLPYRATDGAGRRPRVDPHPVRRESALGRAAHPRRAAETRN